MLHERTSIMADEAQILALEEWLWTEGADLRGRRGEWQHQEADIAQINYRLNGVEESVAA